MFPRCAGLTLLLGACDLVFGLDGRDAASTDMDDAAPCAHGTDFPAGTPVQIGSLGYSVEGARFSPDQQAAYLSLCGLNQPKTTCELWRARYFPEERRFAELFQLDTLDVAGAYDAYPTITADGRFFLWGSGRDNHLDVYVATEDNGMFPANRITKLAAADGLASNEPYVLDDNMTVYFGGLGGSSAAWDIFRSRGPGPGFGSREPVASINSPADDAAPVVTNDELEIFFASKRTGENSFDIYTATRTDANAPFESARVLPMMSTAHPGIDWPLWLSPDRCTLYYINKQSDEPTATATLMVTSRR
jgi:hypothetical protein